MSDIAELFSRDPLSLTNEDLNEIVTHFRKCRAQFNLGVTNAGSTKPKSEKAKAADALASNLNLDLDL